MQTPEIFIDEKQRSKIRND